MDCGPRKSNDVPTLCCLWVFLFRLISAHVQIEKKIHSKAVNQRSVLPSLYAIWTYLVGSTLQQKLRNLDRHVPMIQESKFFLISQLIGFC